jgi:uncharacterized protein
MCYQTPIRDAGNQAHDDYSMDAMKAALLEENSHFTVFGGEPLLTPVDDLEELWRFGKEQFGQNGIQTSATLVTERHYELFRKYNVFVGISLEGPDELNDIRWAGSLERTRVATAAAEAVLHRLLDEGRPVSLITTLHRGNAHPDRLPRLLEWYLDLDRRGLRYVNLHLMEVDSEEVRNNWSLSEEDNAHALLACAALQPQLGQLRFQPLTDMVQLLLGDDANTSCIWNACDPLTTRAVRGIDGDGGRVNCSRTNKSGVDMQKADREMFVRPLALYHVPQESGGCRDCRFWFACKGSCPGESLQGDWRQKTEHCGTLQIVFGELERRLSELGYRPVSASPRTRELVESRILSAYRSGELMSIRRAMNGGTAGSGQPHGDQGHGDHADTARPIITHGDHTDARQV